MKLFRSLFSAGLFLLLIIGFNASQAAGTAARKKCKAEALSGKWYGEMTYTASTSVLNTILEIESVEGCKISGHLYFPAYFNTKVAVEGEVNNDKLVFKGLNLLQGMEYTQRSTYEFPLPADGKLEGTMYTKEEKKGGLSLVHESKINATIIAKIQKEIEQNQTLFGTSLISSEKVSLTAEEIIEQYKKSNDIERWSKIQTMDIGGSMTMGGLEFPMHMAIKSPNKMRMKITFQNINFEMGNNGKQSWEYNPIEDKLKVSDNEDSLSSDNGFNLNEDDLLKKIEEGYTFTEVNNASVDGLQAYRLKLEKEDDWIVVYIDKTNWQVIRKEKSSLELSLHTDHVQFEGLWYPKHIQEIALNTGFNTNISSFTINTIQFDTPYEDAYFEIPEELKDKVVEQEKSSTYYNDLGNEQFSNGEFQQAEANYTKALELAPYDAVIYRNRARARVSLDKVYEGIADYNRSIELDDKVAETYNFRGVAKYFLGDMKGAIADFTSALQVDSTFAQAYSNRGFAYSNNGENDAALSDFEHAVTYDSANAEHHNYHAQMLNMMERYPEAVEAYTKAVELGMQDAATYNRLGVAYSYTDDYESALKYYMKAYELDDTTAQYIENIAGAHYALENYSASIEHYTALLDKNTDNTDEIYYKLGLNYYAQEYYQEARNYFDKAIELNNKNANYFDNRAMTRQQLMDFTGAIEDYSVSISLYPNDANVYYYRGLLKSEIQDEFSGCLDFKKAKELGHEEAAKQLEEHCVLESEAKN